MIDTLKLSKRLQAANLPVAQAEALAEGLAESLKESYVSKEFLQAELTKLKTDLLFWMYAGFFVQGGLLWALLHH